MRKLSIDTPASASGSRTLVVDGKYFHSKYDPLKEAVRRAEELRDPFLAVILSPGLGYCADILARRGCRLITVERHRELARLRPDLGTRVGISTDELKALVRSVEGLDKNRIAILVEPHLDDDAQYYADLRRAAEEAVDELATHAATVAAFEHTWEENLSGNVALIRAARPGGRVAWIEDLEPVVRHARVMLFSAGPSLDGDLELFARAREELTRRYTLVAVDSAFSRVLASGLRPAFVCSIDPQEVKADSLATLGEIPLIASVLSPPSILARARRLYLFGQGHPSEGRFGVPAGAVIADVGGSVATAAATICARFGAAEIVLVGQDLALVEMRMHVKGTFHEAGFARAQNRFRSFEELHVGARRRRGLRRVPGVAGGEVETTPALDSYRLYFNKLAREHPAVRFIQTSPSGARLEMARIRASELLEKTGRMADNSE